LSIRYLTRMLPTSKQLHTLLEQLVTCEDHAEATELAEQLRSGIHEHIEELRGQLPVVPPQIIPPELV
jgi:hypothetical protein